MFNIKFNTGEKEMSNWIMHDDTLYNLNNYNQIIRGDEDEILISTETHNMDWYDNEEKHLSLKFESKEKREEMFEHIVGKLIGIKSECK